MLGLYALEEPSTIHFCVLKYLRHKEFARSIQIGPELVKRVRILNQLISQHFRNISKNFKLTLACVS
jgi:hypothetical protein